MGVFISPTFDSKSTLTCPEYTRYILTDKGFYELWVYNLLTSTRSRFFHGIEGLQRLHLQSIRSNMTFGQEQMWNFEDSRGSNVISIFILCQPSSIWPLIRVQAWNLGITVFVCNSSHRSFSLVTEPRLESCDHLRCRHLNEQHNLAFSRPEGYQPCNRRTLDLLITSDRFFQRLRSPTQESEEEEENHREAPGSAGQDDYA